MALVRGGLAALALAVALAALTAGSAMGATYIDTVAGGGQFPIDEIPALNTTMDTTGVAAAGTDGAFVFTDANGCRVRRVVPGSTSTDTGLVLAAAGNATCGGGLPFSSATSADVPLRNPCCLSRLVSGSFLIADTGNGMVHRWVDGLILTESGNGDSCTNTIPDGVDARSVGYCNIIDVAAHPTTYNRFLFAEFRNQASGGPIVYEVSGTNHIVKHVAGGGCPTPDNVPPAEVCFGPDVGIEWRDNNGFVTVDDGAHVMRNFPLTDFTTTSVVAGTANSNGGTGDNGPATAAKLSFPVDVARSHDGSILVADYFNCRVRRVVIGGNITHFAGATPDGAGISPCRTTVVGTLIAGAGLGDGGPADAGRIGHPSGVAVYAEGVLLATDDNRIRLVDRTTILTAPPSIAATSQSTFTFDGSDLTPSFQCHLDNTPVFTCGNAGDKTETVSPADGKHTMEVFENGANNDGTIDLTRATRTWTVDTQPPNTFALRDPADGTTGLPPVPALSWEAATDATTSVLDSSYELRIDGAAVAMNALAAEQSRCSDGVCTASPEAGLSEGSHTWQIRATDKAGNVRASDTRTIAVGAPPVAGFTIAPNPVLVGRSVTFSSTSGDADGPIARHEWDLDGDGSFETDTGATPAATATYAAPAAIPISLRVTDGIGLTATAALTLQVTNPPPVAGQLGVTVNNGAQYTNDKQVEINLKFPSTTTQILASNDGGFLAPVTFAPPTATIPWMLDSSGPERLPKTVYVRFLLGGLVSETFTDDIILDETAPKVSSASISPSAGTSGAARAAKVTVRGWDVKVKASDSNSGVDKLQVTADKKKPGKLLKYARKLKVKSSKRPRYLRARDRAGNFSKWKRLR